MKKLPSHQDPEFKKLKALWDAKLNESGFVDIETQTAEPKLIQTSTGYNSLVYLKASEEVRTATHEYLFQITSHIEKEDFESESHRIIMIMQSQGFKIKEIVEHLRLLQMPKNRETIRYIIRRYEQKWGIRGWKQEELSPNERQKRWYKKRYKNGK